MRAVSAIVVVTVFSISKYRDIAADLMLCIADRAKITITYPCRRAYTDMKTISRRRKTYMSM